MNSGNLLRTVAIRLIDLLEEHEVPYALMGGLAVPVWGIPRATYDLDVVLSVGDDELGRFLSLAKQRGFHADEVHETGFRDVIKEMEKIRLDWRGEGTRGVEVDVFLVTTAYQEAAFARRCRVRIEDRDAWVLSAADLILHKLAAARPKDLADIQNILAVQGIPDEPYLRTWAKRLGAEERFLRAVEEADLPESEG